MYKKDLVLNDLQGLICHKTKPNTNKLNTDFFFFSYLYIYIPSNSFTFALWFKVSKLVIHFVFQLKYLLDLLSSKKDISWLTAYGNAMVCKFI